MLSKTRAIVLHHVKYGESSLIVHFYSQRYGRLACIVSGVRSKKKTFAQHYFQPLTILDIDIYYKQNHSLHRLKELTCPVHFISIPFDIVKISIAIFLAEVLYKTLHEEESNMPLFDYLTHSIQILDIKDNGIAGFHLAFLLQFSRYLGIYPADLIEPLQGKHQPELQLFRNLPGGTEKILQQLMTTSLTQIEEIVMDNVTRSVLLDRIIQYYAQHLDGMSKVKSLQVLKEVFN